MIMQEYSILHCHPPLVDIFLGNPQQDCSNFNIDVMSSLIFNGLTCITFLNIKYTKEMFFGDKVFMFNYFCID